MDTTTKTSPQIGTYLGTLFIEMRDGTVDHESALNLYEWSGAKCEVHPFKDEVTYGNLYGKVNLCWEEEMKQGVIMYLESEAEAGRYAPESK